MVDFSLALAVIRSEIDGPALQSSPPLLLLMDLPARPLESFFEPLGVSYPLAGRLMKRPAGGTVASVFNVFLKAQMSLDVLWGFTLLTRPPWYWVGPLAVHAAAWILRNVDVVNWSLSCGSWRFFGNALHGFSLMSLSSVGHRPEGLFVVIQVNCDVLGFMLRWWIRDPAVVLFITGEPAETWLVIWRLKGRPLQPSLEILN